MMPAAHLDALHDFLMAENVASRVSGVIGSAPPQASLGTGRANSFGNRPRGAPPATPEEREGKRAWPEVLAVGCARCARRSQDLIIRAAWPLWVEQVRWGRRPTSLVRSASKRREETETWTHRLGTSARVSVVVGSDG